MPRNLRIAVAAVVACAASAANAQVRSAYEFPEAGARGPMQLGTTPFFVTPYVGLAVGRDDNVLLSSTNERASTYWALSPGITLDARGEATVFALKYQGQVGRYAQSDDDNYVDHATRAAFDVAFDRRNFLSLGLDYVRSHDPRGSTDRPVAGVPDKYRQVTPRILYSFGSPGAAGRVEVYASELDRRYLNNRQSTAFSDRELRELGAALYWRLAPKTYLLAEARQTEISYRVANPGSSGEERRVYGGVTWEATAATRGTFKAGRLERESDLGVDDSATSWEGIISWLPRSYSKFDFYTSRQTGESTGVGRYILSAIGGVSWNHAWSSVLSTSVDLRLQKDNYRGFDRRDEIKSVGVRAGYKFRPWLTLGAEFSHTTRDSSLPTSDYDKNLYLLTATSSM